jgi:hypothetical protein
VIGLYELLGNPTTQLIEPAGPFLIMNCTCVRVVQLHVFSLLDLCCNVLYKFCMDTMFVSSFTPFVVVSLNGNMLCATSGEDSPSFIWGSCYSICSFRVVCC